jgi:hypothetical protein
MLASLLSRAAPGLRFNEHLDNEDGPLVFAHVQRPLGGVPGGLQQLGKFSQPIEPKWADLASVGKIAA